MARRDIDSIWDRETRNNINENFIELYNHYLGAGLDAQEARQKAEEAIKKANSVQEQFNQVVIEGDSSVEAAQARVDSEGNTYSTLKERLDDKETEFTSQLAQTTEQFADLPKTVLEGNQDTFYLPSTASKGKLEVMALGKSIYDGMVKHTLPFSLTSTGSGNSQQVDIPTEFDYVFSDNPKIYRLGEGIYYTDYNISKYEPISNNIYYVSKNGSSSNDGRSKTTPKSNIREAIALINSDGVPEAKIVVEAGIYNLGWTTDKANCKLSVVCENGQAIFTGNLESPTWNHESGNVYTTSKTTGAAPIHVYDRKYLDEYGDYKLMNKVNSVAEVENNAGSYFIENGNVYVHTYNGRIPDSDVCVPLYVSTGGHNDYDLYMRNITFEGGNKPFNLTIKTGNKAYLNQCRFLHAGDGNGLSVLSGGEVYLYDCIASNNSKDGFNYHESLPDSPKVFEVNCISRSNGWDGGESHNGSTTHGIVKIIRVNGEYYNNLRNIHDVNTTRNVMFGCKAYNSRGSSTIDNSFNLGVGFSASTFATKTWVYGGEFYGGATSDINVYDGCELFHFDINLEEHIVNTFGTGKITEMSIYFDDVSSVKVNTTEIFSPITLRSLPSGVSDSLDFQSGIHTKKISDDIVVDGSLNWELFGSADETVYYAHVKGFVSANNVKSESDADGVVRNDVRTFPIRSLTTPNEESVRFHNADRLYIYLLGFTLDSMPSGRTMAGFKEYLNQYPITMNLRLNEQVESEILGLGQINSNPNGKISVNPKLKIIKSYGSGITVSIPIQEIDKIVKIENGVKKKVDLTNVSIDGDKTLITIDGAIDSDIFEITYMYPESMFSLPLIQYSFPKNLATQVDSLSKQVDSLSRQLMDLIKYQINV